MFIKVLITIVLIYVVYRVVKMFRRVNSDEVKAYRVDTAPPQGEDLVQDPFCGTYVPKSQAYVQDIDGRKQYFCSRDCCEKYLAGNK